MERRESDRRANGGSQRDPAPARDQHPIENRHDVGADDRSHGDRRVRSGAHGCLCCLTVANGDRDIRQVAQFLLPAPRESTIHFWHTTGF
jgi:hypothetical protein